MGALEKWRMLAAAGVVLALAVGVLIGHARWLDPVIGRIGRMLVEQPPLQPPDASARMYRERRVAMFRALPASEVDVVMLGDSHTEGGLWSELLPGVRVLNRGLGWDSSQDVLDRLDEVIARRPRSVVLLVGIVDLRLGAEPQDVAARVEAIVGRLRAAGIRVVVQSVLPVAPQLRERTNARVAGLNERLKALPDYLDLHPVLVKDGALDPSLTHDGVHLSGPAYLRWAEVVRGALARQP